MTAPNIVNVATITGKTAVQAVGTSAAAIVTNPGSSNKVFKINALYVSNVDGTNAANINVSVQRSGTDYHIGKTISVPADSTLDVISKSLYLEEKCPKISFPTDASFAILAACLAVECIVFSHKFLSFSKKVDS